MEKKSTFKLFALCAASALLLAGCHVNRRQQAQRKATLETTVEAKHVETKSDTDLPLTQEVRQSYKLAASARVEVSGINGLLQIETTDGSDAEVYVVRSVRNQEDFDQRKLVIEQKGDSLVVRVRNNRERSFWSMLGGRNDERQRAYLKLPRKVELEISGINGKTDIGEITGRVELSGLNGPVKVARATGGFNLSGANGNIEATIAQLTKGVEVHGVNGNLDLRFSGEVNADVEVHGVNGQISPELPNLSVKEQKRGSLEARLGNGGAPIDVSGVNGNIHLLPAAAK